MQQHGLFAQLRERVGDVRLMDVAFEVDVEEIFERLAELGLRLELADVDSRGREHFEHARELAGLVADREQERALAMFRRRGGQLAHDVAGVGRREHEEARVVVGMIGDVFGQHREPVEARGLGRGDRGDRPVLFRRDFARGDAGVLDRDDPGRREGGEIAPALGEDQRMAEHFAHVVDRRAGDAEEPVLHPPHDLGDRRELVLGKDVVAVAHGAGDRVVDRHDADVGFAVDDRDGDLTEGGDAGCGDAVAFTVEKCIEDEFGMGTVDALICAGEVHKRALVRPRPPSRLAIAGRSGKRRRTKRVVLRRRADLTRRSRRPCRMAAGAVPS